MRAYRDFWTACARWGRLEWIAENCAESAQPLTCVSALDASGSEPPGTCGLHWPERWGGQPFRWTQPVATVPLLAPGAGLATGWIELLPIRPPEELAHLRVTVDGRLVPLEHVGHGTRMRFEVAGGGLRWIGLACPPLPATRRAPGDRRELALPLAALELRAGGG